jgi:hypothetical protein
MGKNPDTEKLLQLSGVIVWVGLALVFLQLAAQIVLSFGWLVKNAGGDLGSFYIGVVVLLIGAVLMALLSFSSRMGNSRKSIFDSGTTDTLKKPAGLVTANVTGHAPKDTGGGPAASATNDAVKDASKDAAKDAASKDAAKDATPAAGGTLPSPSPSSSPLRSSSSRPAPACCTRWRRR